MSMKIYVGDKSFGKYFNDGLDLLKDVNTGVFLSSAEGIIAGTENYDANLLSTAKNLKVISRMGVGYDNVDLDYCKEHGIIVTYTPDILSDSVAELTICQMINLLREIPQINHSIHNQKWYKPMGKKLSEVSIGVIGVGRIGQKVIRLLQPFGPKCIYAYDIDAVKIQQFWIDSNFKFKICMKSGIGSTLCKELLEKSDIVTVHIPMSKENYHLVDDGFINYMKDDSYLINTSRGGILDENALKSNKLRGVALDVFEKEPYAGVLDFYENILMTSHIGSMTLETRKCMEMQAVMNCKTVLSELRPENVVPELETVS